MIDTHTHLDDPRYDSERQSVIDSLQSNNIELVINASCDYKSMIDSYRLATNNANIYCTLGMHPHDAKSFDDKFVSKLIQLAPHNKVVAIGEIGLDYHYDLSDRQVQRDVFAYQIELADQLHLPIVLHIREAYQDTLDILTAQRQYLNNGVLWHCYSGSGEYAKTFVKQGHYFAFGGAITFKNAHKQSVIDCIPSQLVLSETDCPYMTPTPHRGKTNYPQYVSYVVEQLATMYNMTTTAMEDTISNNCRQLFRRIQ